MRRDILNYCIELLKLNMAFTLISNVGKKHKCGIIHANAL